MSTEVRVFQLSPNEMDVAPTIIGLGYRVEARDYSLWERAARLMRHPRQELKSLLLKGIKSPRDRSRILRAVLVILT